MAETVRGCNTTGDPRRGAREIFLEGKINSHGSVGEKGGEDWTGVTGGD